MVSSFDRASLASRNDLWNVLSRIHHDCKRSNYNNENTLALIIQVNFAWNKLLEQILLIFILYTYKINKRKYLVDIIFNSSSRYNSEYNINIYIYFDHLYSHLYSHEPFRSLISIKY